MSPVVASIEAVPMASVRLRDGPDHHVVARSGREYKV